jgi:hypothetical protein
MFYEKPLCLVVHAGNEPEMIPADVEHGVNLFSDGNSIRARINFPNIVEAGPCG